MQIDIIPIEERRQLKAGKDILNLNNSNELRQINLAIVKFLEDEEAYKKVDIGKIDSKKEAKFCHSCRVYTPGCWEDNDDCVECKGIYWKPNHQPKAKNYNK